MKDFFDKAYLKQIRLIALFLIAYLLANFVNLILAQQFTSPPQLSGGLSAASQSAQELKPEKEYAERMEALFPAPKITSAPNPVTAAGSAPLSDKPTLLEGLNQGRDQIQLMGTAIGDRASIAMLSVGSEQFVVSEGQKLGDYLIKKIEKSKVDFQRGAETFSIYTKEGLKGQMGAAAPPPAEAEGAGPTVLRRTLNRREIDTFLNNPQQMAGMVNFTPVAKEGTSYGIQINSLQAGSFLYRLGFRTGDILININAKDLKTPEDSLMAWQMLKNEDEIAFKLDRSGKTMHINFNIK